MQKQGKCLKCGNEEFFEVIESNMETVDDELILIEKVKCDAVVDGEICGFVHKQTLKFVSWEEWKE